MQVITVKNNQNIFDIAIQHSGSVEAIFSYSIPITKQLQAGMLIKPMGIKNRKIIDFFKIAIIAPATSDNDIASGVGIGSMKIGSTFRIG